MCRLGRDRPSVGLFPQVQAHLQELEQKLLEPQQMKTALEQLVHCCHGDDRPECPILETLGDENAAFRMAAQTTGQRQIRGLRSGSA